MELILLPDELAVLRLGPSEEIPDWVMSSRFFSVTKTTDELSIFCDGEVMPDDDRKVAGWRALRVAGQLDLEIVGILASLAVPLAAKQIPIFSISTYDTDYLLVQKDDLAGALAVLRDAGHSISESS